MKLYFSGSKTTNPSIGYYPGPRNHFPAFETGLLPGNGDYSIILQTHTEKDSDIQKIIRDFVLRENASTKGTYNNRVRRKFKGMYLMPNISYGSAKNTRHILPKSRKTIVEPAWQLCVRPEVIINAVSFVFIFVACGTSEGGNTITFIISFAILRGIFDKTGFTFR